jgi:hypothetical protein
MCLSDHLDATSSSELACLPVTDSPGLHLQFTDVRPGSKQCVMIRTHIATESDSLLEVDEAS